MHLTHTQTGPTDLRHFDPTLTNLPPTISDLITTDRALHLEGFDYVAPPLADSVRKFPTDDGKSPTDQGKSPNGTTLDSSNEESAHILTQLVSVEVNNF